MNKLYTLHAILLSTVIFQGSAQAYPIDDAGRTGIERLEAAWQIQNGFAHGTKLPQGALLKSKEVQLNLLTDTEIELPGIDNELSLALLKLMGKDAKYYSVSVLDLSDSERPIYAAHQAEKNFNPASLGKIFVAIALFQKLSDIYPDDIQAREQILRNSIITADQFIKTDHHKVPFWNASRKKRSYRPIKQGDQANLWSYLDWMLSASSNAAASMVMKQLILLNHFGKKYPVSSEQEKLFFKTTSRKKLGVLLDSALSNGISANALDPNKLKQGKFFTREGKRRVASTGGSRMTAREMMKLLLYLEQGKVVDSFSSLELKKLLYLTRKRVRYASAPILKNSALYFKSGSLYSCKPEPGFICGKYQGNKINQLNSIAIIESTSDSKSDDLFYMVVLSTNLLKENAAWKHRVLAGKLHTLIKQRHLNRSRLKNKVIHSNDDFLQPGTTSGTVR